MEVGMKSTFTTPRRQGSGGWAWGGVSNTQRSASFFLTNRHLTPRSCCRNSRSRPWKVTRPPPCRCTVWCTGAGGGAGTEAPAPAPADTRQGKRQGMHTCIQHTISHKSAEQHKRTCTSCKRVHRVEHRPCACERIRGFEQGSCASARPGANREAESETKAGCGILWRQLAFCPYTHMHNHTRTHLKALPSFSLPNPILYLGIPCALVKLME
jgi:hypothetical protein